MLGFALRFVVFALSLFRKLLDYLSEVVCSFLCKGTREQLPPIRNKVLLHSATTLARKIRKGELKSIDVVKAYIHRIREVQPTVNAVVDERFAEAVEEALRVDELIASGIKTEEELALDTPLLGVPVTIKEAIAVKGCLFTVGLVARKGVRADADADVVTILKKAGAIPIAITITPELCFWWESYNKLYGRSRNPYDTRRTVGGSSGGEGCLLGSAGSVIGIGNDIGGSIRIPAAFNGVFGHKPSRGIVSNQGEYPPAAPTLQTYLMTGPFCRYASDMKPLMQLLAGSHAKKLRLSEPVDFHDLKIYYMEDDGGNPLVSPVNAEITKALKKVLDYFHTTYGVVPQKKVLASLKHSFEIWANVITTSDMQPVSVEMTGRKGEANLLIESLKWLIGRSDHVLPIIISAILNKIRFTKDEKLSAVYYQMATELQLQFEDMLQDDGIFLYPTNPDLALYHGQALVKPFNIGYTCIFNLLGLPISQCPLGLSLNGLPIGIQVVGGLNNDKLTLAVAEELERAFGGWISPCPIQLESKGND